MRTRLLVALGLATVGRWLGGCSSEPSGPVATTFDVSFATGFNDDGAVMFTISGGPVESVETPGYLHYSAQLDPNTLQVIVVGELHPGPIARIRIADGRLLSQYSASISQVAARHSYVQRDPVSYSLTVAP